MKHIELFAGCGGLSLGLKAAGFDLLLANEISEMAAETFAYNLLGFKLDEVIKSKSFTINNVSDLERSLISKTPSLHVGDIHNLIDMYKQLTPNFTRMEVELVSGGPPCQGFSLAGQRKEMDPKNKLPYYFLDFVSITNPKFVLLENVLGITQPFKKDGGVKYPWFELAKAFLARNYISFCFIVNARDFGVPQNRPRFILFAVRKDQHNVIKKMGDFDDELENTLELSSKFLGRKENDLKSISINHSKEIGLPLIKLDDVKKLNNYGFNIDHNKTEITTSEAIEDLIEKKKPSKYVEEINRLFTPHLKHPKNLAITSKVNNFLKRNHTSRVKQRFKHLQIASKHGINLDFSKLKEFLNNETFVENYINALLCENEIDISESESAKNKLEKLLIPLETKKHSQSALKANEPAPAQLTIPDDYCHYSLDEPRVLTVREMARIQSFPDSFVFRSKVTTGGLNRRTEVPQYTQVGNAVPPLLGYKLGEFIKRLRT